MNDLNNVKKVFENNEDVFLAYIFGSRATNEANLSSDYDFAVYLNPKDKNKISNTKLDLLAKITSTLKTDNVDLLVLNTSEKVELNYEVITKGKLLKEVEPYKLIIEPNILNEYFDFKESLIRNGLTKST